MTRFRKLSASRQSNKRCVFVACLCVAALATSPALAFRPFDGTDAAVADTGKMEVELQPAGRLHDDSGTTLIAPATRFNLGLIEGWEGVLEGVIQNPLSPSGPSSLSAAGAFLKGVVRPGSLQDKAGPSVATEFGVLLPDSIGDTGFGASAAWIVSQRWDWGTVNLNAATTLTREHHGDIFLGTIIEDRETSRRSLLREGIRAVRNGVRPRRIDLASQRGSRRRYRGAPCDHECPAGRRTEGGRNIRFSAVAKRRCSPLNSLA
jgi:hypothetical protein